MVPYLSTTRQASGRFDVIPGDDVEPWPWGDAAAPAPRIRWQGHEHPPLVTRPCRCRSDESARHQRRDRLPGPPALWTWLAAWCAGAGPEHIGTCARIAVFTERWHDVFERQSRHVWLGLAPASDEQLAQIRSHPAPALRPAQRPARQRVVVDSKLWLTAGEQRFERDVSNYYGSPETIAGGGVKALKRGDTAAALFFFQKSIDLLHTLYVGTGMQARRPSHRDDPIIEHYLRTLGDIRRIHPDIDLTRSVIEVTCCERFLRNLVRSLNHPELADHVTGPVDVRGHVRAEELSDVEFEGGLALHQLGFGVEGVG